MPPASLPYINTGLGALSLGSSMAGGKKGGGSDNSVSFPAYQAQYMGTRTSNMGGELFSAGEPLRLGVIQDMMNELGYGLAPNSIASRPGGILSRLGIHAGTGAGSANISPLRDATESAYSTAARQLLESSANRGGALNYNFDQLARSRAAQLGQNRFNLLQAANTVGYAGVPGGNQAMQTGLQGVLGAAGIAQQGQMQSAQLAQQNAMMAGQGKGNLLGLSLIAGKGTPNQQTGTGAFTAPYAASNFKLNPSYSGLPQLSTTY